jgi:hypothetical protein
LSHAFDEGTEAGGAPTNPRKVIPYGEFFSRSAKRETICGVPAIPESGRAQQSLDPPDERVEDVRARIRCGYYDRPAVLDEIVRRILVSLEGPADSSDELESQW